MFDLSDFYAVPDFIQFSHMTTMDSISAISWIVLSVYTDLSVCKGYLSGCVFWVFLVLFLFFSEGNKRIVISTLVCKRSKLV